jgi:hypothetical protein
MPYFLKVLSEGNKYLSHYDPDYIPEDPSLRIPGMSGIIATTNDIAEALPFETAIAAMETWKMQSATVPFRLDGEPNRPLSAHTVEVIHAKLKDL